MYKYIYIYNTNNFIVLASYEYIAEKTAASTWLQKMYACSAGHSFTLIYSTSPWFNEE